jgi:8-oxo-dGTP pyrophosphatase MutT (NUDIX family)
VAGDVLNYELPGVVKRYCAALFRSGVVGAPGDEVARRARVVREALEETGLRTEVVRFLWPRSYLLDPNSGRRGNVMNVYLLRTRGEPDVRLSDEHDAYRWVSDSDAAEIFAANDLMRSVIHQYFESERSS